MAILDRGFKTWAERTSLSLRAELGLLARHRLEPKRLADYLDVIIWTPQDVPGITKECIEQLLNRDPWGWSAVTCTVGEVAIVIYNTKHPPGRQAGDITHELAHVILDHKAGTLIMSQDGSMVMRSYDRKQEDEADWFSRCLLLPRESLMWARRQHMSTKQIATHFGVTDPLVVYRLRMTGVDAQIRATARRQR